jgi:hypothetical protein
MLHRVVEASDSRTSSESHKGKPMQGEPMSNEQSTAIFPDDNELRQYIYEPHTRSRDGALRYVFMSGAYMEKAYGGRIYTTHRRFRKLAAIRRTPVGDILKSQEIESASKVNTSGEGGARP